MKALKLLLGLPPIPPLPFVVNVSVKHFLFYSIKSAIGNAKQKAKNWTVY